MSEREMISRSHPENEAIRRETVKWQQRENDALRAENEKLHREAAIRIDALNREQEAHLRTIADYNRARVESEKLRERLAEADECNRRVSDENVKLRDAYDTDALTISYNLGYTCGKDIAKDRIESAEQAYVRLDASMNRLKAAFRVNMLRAFPHMSHDEIDAEIEAAIRESGDD